jgi:hypothetical protein
MKIAEKLVASLTFFAAAAFLFLACIVVGLPIFASAQGVDAGANAIYTYAATATAPSTSFVDASVFTGSSSSDVCGKINAVLTWANYPASGTVIDARGIVPVVNTRNYTCSMNPWAGITTPSIILLPSGTITTSYTWVLPPYTRLIGVGAPGVMPSGTPSGTEISAGTLTGAIIQFGTSAPAVSVSVESLTLNGNNVSGVSGIVNEFAQEHSYVRNVTFRNFVATALVIGSTPGDANPENSGPYEDLNFLGATDGCVTLNAKNTRGIHNMTCVSNKDSTPLPAAGVLLDGPANVIEDTHFEGFQDGIRIGSQTSTEAFADVITNADGNSNNTQLQMTNTVHIGTNGVVDLTMTGIRADTFGGMYAAPNSIEDDVTSTTLSDSTVALYALGEGDVLGGGGGIIGHARFTTSPSVPSWSVGSLFPSGSIACKTGGLYSSTSGTSGGHDTLFVCEGGGWVGK